MRKALRGLAFMLAAGLPAVAVADEIVVGDPRVDGVPLDWCRAWGQGCGWPSAHAFCRDRGYERATHYEIYNPGRTFLMRSDNLCTGPTCTAFRSVTCKLPAGLEATAPPPLPPVTQREPVRPSRVRFDYPRNAGVPADWCSIRGIDCGWGGAHKFCEFRGFDRAVSFTTYHPGASATLGDPRHCQGPGCTALRSVVCENQAVAEPPPGG
ncbi:MAG: hypothetical protein KIT16_17825 [Rhodospirillaceae bacterium]|nr:hypothetical protein [Rhodospirillaceae bacterium]